MCHIDGHGSGDDVGALFLGDGAVAGLDGEDAGALVLISMIMAGLNFWRGQGFLKSAGRGEFGARIAIAEWFLYICGFT